ncbi:hypothetical protein AB0K16_22625 [Nonomuraea jabiensis]|uniref:hypothetical protein n=1 Tax=Nonomuraea jabiensis TaxID=882448 RepID=UPI003428CEA3
MSVNAKPYGSWVTNQQEVHPMHCRACGVFIGWFGHRRAVFCPDLLCVITREWVWEDEDVIDLIVFLQEQEGLSSTDTAKIVGMHPKKVRTEYGNFLNRNTYAQA